MSKTIDMAVNCLSEAIMIKLCRKREFSDIQKIKIKYGIEVLLSNLFKTIILLGIALSLKVFFEYALITIGFKPLRKYTFGRHASSTIGCILFTACSMILPIPLLNYIILSDLAICLILSCIALVIYVVGPRDTEKYPITCIKLRKRLKQKGTFVVMVIMAISFLANYHGLGIFIIYGTLLQVISIIPYKKIVNVFNEKLSRMSFRRKRNVRIIRIKNWRWYCKLHH